MSSRRLFVALRPPDHVAEALLDTMEGISGARWQDADNLHITLRFIGEVDRHTQADVQTALADVIFAPFTIKISGVGHFEGRKRPNAIWARVLPSAQLDELQMRVEMACRRAGLPPLTRKFVPHITLARLNSGSGFVAGWLNRHGTLSPLPWPANRFSLYESDLTPNGALYSEVRKFP
ncbi:MAG: RNA 2',3'-cyclic phosphodiesterase [Alteraurantiacibacter sp.]